MVLKELAMGTSLRKGDVQATSLLLARPTATEAVATIGPHAGESPFADDVSLVIRKVLLVRAPVTLAFDYFTQDIDQWWPAPPHSAGCGLERGLGGRIFETRANGGMHVWGRITEWQPPFHLRFTWAPDQGDPMDAEVQISFAPNGSDRARIEFSHRGWRLHQTKDYIDYRTYWDDVLINGYQNYVRRRRP
jgi:uncharacterized protein YndB with AHSA1/START domain